MKKILLLLLPIFIFVLVFVAFDGMIRIILLFILFPLYFFYCPLILRDKPEEKTDEAKDEEKGIYRRKWDD